MKRRKVLACNYMILEDELSLYTEWDIVGFKGDTGFHTVILERDTGAKSRVYRMGPGPDSEGSSDLLWNKIDDTSCPFCGDTQIYFCPLEERSDVEEVEEKGFIIWKVCCDACGAEGPESEKKEIALREWQALLKKIIRRKRIK